MERKLDAVEAHQAGYKLGQQHALELINKYCEFKAENIPEIVCEVVKLQTKCAKLEIQLLEAENA